MTTPVELVLSRLKRVDRRSEGQWQTECPAHQDDTRSLSVSVGRDDDRAILDCKAGCSTAAVLSTIQLEMKDLYSKPPPRQVRPESIDYLYQDEQGEVLFRVLRWYRWDSYRWEKSFAQHPPNGSGGWKKASDCGPGDSPMKGVRRVLYRLPQVLAAKEAGKQIWVVEGEKDVATLEGLGEVATCNPGGAQKGKSPGKKWTKAYTDTLLGADVVLISDNDEAGRGFAASVADRLHGVAASVRVLCLPDLPLHGDVTDWLTRHGGTSEELEGHAGHAPEWVPGTVLSVDAPEAPQPPAEAKEETKAPPEVVGPLDSWTLREGRLARYTSKTRCVSMFDGVPEAILVREVWTEDETQPGGWATVQEVTYRFKLRGRSRPIIRRTGPGRDAFRELLKDVDLDAATHATRGDEIARIQLWAVSKNRPERKAEWQAIGPQGERGWIAAPNFTVKGGQVQRLENGSVGFAGEGEEFRRYRFGVVDDDTARNVCRWIFDHLLPCDRSRHGKYTLPLLGAFLSAPLWSYLGLESWQRYAFWVQGPSGVGKTVLSRYFWSFWGDFAEGRGLTSWMSTATYLEGLLHRCKGVPLLVTDWKEANMGREAYRGAMALLQAYADRTSRGRARRGGTQVEKKQPPRCTLIVDGEDVPKGEQSTLGRLLVMSVEAKGDDGLCADATDETLDPKMIALLPAITARWVAHVQSNHVALSRELGEFVQFFEEGMRRLSTNRARLIRAYAVNLCSAVAFMRFAGNLAGVDVAEWCDRARMVHLTMAQAQLSSVSGEAAGSQFMDALSSSLLSGSSRLAPKEGARSGENPFDGGGPSSPKVGIYHEGWAYVWPHVALGVAQGQHQKSTGNRIRFTQAAIEQQLNSEGSIKVIKGQRVGKHLPGKDRARAWRISLQDLGADVDEQAQLYDEAKE